MKTKRKYVLPKATLLLILVISILCTCVYNTFAWVQISSKKGIYPFYNVELNTPTDSFYVKVEVAVDEIFNPETNDYDVIYEEIEKVDLSQKAIYPGDRLNFRFSVYNFGGQNTSISIYFKDIIDTKVGENNDFFSKDIVVGSPSFNGNDGGINNTYGFLFYIGERMSYNNNNLTPISVDNTVCSNGLAECYMNNSSVPFATNIGIKASSYNSGYNEIYFNMKMEELKNYSTDFENQRKSLVYECFTPTQLDWYILLDRASTIETANSLFSIGTILFAVD